ncbi:hypothetical protein B0H10DRAFT_2228330 [Mycena sp. CBHHK59/15]|nr:hypothetical protein B0H10DRAFT_2228330 [Mycena sp. CBHHK59/15]
MLNQVVVCVIGDTRCRGDGGRVAHDDESGKKQTEHRDVPDIRYISELLGGIARALTQDAEKLASETTTLKQWGIGEDYGYKVFVTFVLAKTLELASSPDAGVSHDVLFVMNAKIVVGCQISSVEQSWTMNGKPSKRANTSVDVGRPDDRRDESGMSFLPSPYLPEVRERKSALASESTVFSLYPSKQTFFKKLH